MATWQYRCQSCGGMHEVSARPAGAMLLRCTVTREWAWHDESAFLAGASPAASPRSAGAARSARKAARGKAGRARAGSRPRAGARGASSSRARASGKGASRGRTGRR